MFANFDTRSLALLALALNHRLYLPDEVVLIEGALNDSLHFVRSGSLQVAHCRARLTPHAPRLVRRTRCVPCPYHRSTPPVRAQVFVKLNVPSACWGARRATTRGRRQSADMLTNTTMSTSLVAARNRAKYGALGAWLISRKSRVDVKAEGATKEKAKEVCSHPA